MTERFQVDLTGMVDLLSRHLYSGPQAFIRELIQNGVDAITARRELDPAAPEQIRLTAGVDEAGRATLDIVDTGVGLTAPEAAELLATIGRSSKRDPEFGLGRTEFIGQFGIGMLAAFMVADRIVVHSRSARPGAQPIRWEGRADGTFDVQQLASGATYAGTPIEVGTVVTITARPEAEHWLARESVIALAREYASLLPYDIAVRESLPGDEPVWLRISEPELPWRVQHLSQAARRAALSDYCERTFGFTPLGSIDIDLPVAGVSGVAFVLPQAVSPGSGQHRVYMKRMLLGPRVDRVLPDWAFFVRAVIDADALSPTASREQLHEDETLLAVREAIGEQLKRWARTELSGHTPLAHAVIGTHHLALRGVALTDSAMLDLVTEILPFETTDGPMTLAAAHAQGEIVYTTTTEAYRRVATVARAEGLVVVNAGYVYDAELLEQLGRRSGWRVRQLESSDLVQVLGLIGLEREWEVSGAVGRARDLLEEADCDVSVRVFSPESVPAILLRDSEGEHRRDLNRERDASPDLWGGLLDSLAGDTTAARTRTLVLNDNSAVVRRLLAAPAGDVFASGLTSLYLSAVMLAGEGLRGAESALLADALGVLLDGALRGTDEMGGAAALDQTDPNDASDPNSEETS